jgi:putative intracellular protease/amidase
MANKIVSAVCHGPAVLSHVKFADGEGYLLDDQRVTGFSNEKEEEEAGLTAVMPSLLEDVLSIALGGTTRRRRRRGGRRFWLRGEGG